jgi:predicted RNA binding protein YcfA (HicA-like mRNA interferase family)
MKVRDALRLMHERGCIAVSTRGSHQKWKLPTGHTIPLVVNHKNDDVTPAVLMTLRQVFRSAGLTFDR